MIENENDREWKKMIENDIHKDRRKNEDRGKVWQKEETAKEKEKGRNGDEETETKIEVETDSGERRDRLEIVEHEKREGKG